MSRKYRHRGYRDGEHDDERSRSKPPPRRDLTPEERLHRKGMRHAIDRDAREVLRCHNCGRGVADFGKVTAQSACPHCSSALHCCRNCRHFDSAARWQCRASIDKPVPNKIQSNHCKSYEPKLVLDSTGRRSATRGSKPDDPRSQFENLFKR